MRNRYASAAAVALFFVLAYPAGSGELPTVDKDRPQVWHITPPPPPPAPPPGSPGDCVIRVLVNKPHDFPHCDNLDRYGLNMTVETLLNAYTRKDVTAFEETLAEGFRFESDDPDFAAAYPAGFSRSDEIASATHLFAGADSIRVHVGSWSACHVSGGVARIETNHGPESIPWPSPGGRVVLEGVALSVWLKNGTRIVTGPETHEFVVVRVTPPPTSVFDLGPGLFQVVRWTEHASLAATSAPPVPRTGEPDSTMLASHEGAGAPTVLAVRPRESPARGALRLDLALPSREPARVELYDVAGRRVKAWEIPSGPARSLSFEAGAAGALPAGVYWLRLAQGARVAKSHIVSLK